MDAFYPFFPNDGHVDAFLGVEDGFWAPSFEDYPETMLSSPRKQNADPTLLARRVLQLPNVRDRVFLLPPGNAC